jgi:glycosyltransferase involved in cell wall biosynthesis
MRILHLNDRLSRRGGADLHLLGVIDDLKSVAQQCLAYGRRDDGLELDIETASVGGLDARTPRPCSLQELFHSYRPDVVHVHNVMNPKALVQAADWGAMMTVQDHRTFCPGRGKQKLDGSVCREVQSKDLCRSCFTEDSYFEEIWDLTQERMDALKRMKAVVVLSDYMKNELIQAGVQKPEIHVIPPFVHGLDSGSENTSKPCVLFVGRLVASKGIQDVVRAWQLAETDLPLVIAGAGPERGKIGAPGIEWAGWVGPEELALLYQRAAALVMAPRWQEPFGIVGLEAKHFKLPVVAWESGGIAEWEPEVLVPWGDVSGLAAGLRSVLSGKVLPQGTNSDYTVEQVGDLKRVYQGMMATM